MFLTNERNIKDDKTFLSNIIKNSKYYFMAKHFEIDNKFTINWNLLSLCNYKCPYCNAKSWRKTGSIVTKNQIQKVFEAISLSDYDFELSFLGGEPLLYPHLYYIIENAPKNVKAFEIVSNGSTAIKKIYNNVCYTFSFHPLQSDGEQILKNIQYIKKYQDDAIDLKIMLIPNDKIIKKCMDFYNRVKDYNIVIYFTFTSGYDWTNFKIPDIIKNKEEYFIENGKLLTTYDINNHSLNFKDMNCYMEFFQLETNGNIHIFCQNKTDNIYKNKNYFKNIKYPMVCNRNKCFESSCGLECLKYI